MRLFDVGKTHSHSEGRRQASKAGFSIIEMLLGIVIMAISIGAIESAMLTSRTLFYRQKILTQAVAVGETITEELLLLDSSDDDLATGVHAAYFTIDGARIDVDGGGAPLEAPYYTTEWTSSELVEVPGIRMVEVEIIWDESGGDRSISWHTYRN